MVYWSERTLSVFGLRLEPEAKLSKEQYSPLILNANHALGIPFTPLSVSVFEGHSLQELERNSAFVHSRWMGLF
jgi:hypothetical protein